MNFRFLLFAVLSLAACTVMAEEEIDHEALIAEAIAVIEEASSNYVISAPCLAALGTEAAPGVCWEDAVKLGAADQAALDSFLLSHGMDSMPDWLAGPLHRDDHPGERSLLRKAPPSSMDRKIQATCTQLCAFYKQFCCYYCPSWPCG